MTVLRNSEFGGTLVFCGRCGMSALAVVEECGARLCERCLREMLEAVTNTNQKGDVV